MLTRFQVQIFRLRQPQLIATRPLTCGYLRDSRKLSVSEPFDLLDFSRLAPASTFVQPECQAVGYLESCRSFDPPALSPVSIEKPPKFM